MDKIKNLNYDSFSLHRRLIMGVAAILILACHIASYSTLPKNIFTSLIYDLNIGVEIFLIMSGIGLYFSLSNKKYRFGDYYLKRILNVYCIYLIITLPDVIYQDLILSSTNIKQVLFDLTGISFWLGETKEGWYVHFAMALYLIYPVIFKIIKWAEEKKALLPITALSCAAVIAFCFVSDKKLPDFYSTYEIAIARIPAFLVGCCLGSLVYNKKPITKKMYFAAALGIIIWFAVKATHKPLIYERFSHILLSLTICLFIVILTELIPLKPLVKCLEFFGGISLETYLVHLALLRAVKANYGKISPLKYAIVIAVAVVISYFVAKIRVAIIKGYTKRKDKKELSKAD